MSTKRVGGLVVALALPLALVLLLSLVFVAAPALASMSGSTVNSVTPNPVSPGAPVDLCFNVTVSSPDDEYMQRFDVNLPDGWTVNSVTNTPGNTGATTTQGVDAGNVVYWQGVDWAPWYNDTFNFCANVTIPDPTGAPWSLPWNIIGEGYGGAPHSVNGTIGLEAFGLAMDKSVTPMTDAPYHGVVTYTVSLSNSGPVSDTAVFSPTRSPRQWILVGGLTIPAPV